MTIDRSFIHETWEISCDWVGCRAVFEIDHEDAFGFGLHEHNAHERFADEADGWLVGSRHELFHYCPAHAAADEEPAS